VGLVLCDLGLEVLREHLVVVEVQVATGPGACQQGKGPSFSAPQRHSLLRLLRRDLDLREPFLRVGRPAVSRATCADRVGSSLPFLLPSRFLPFPTGPGIQRSRRTYDAAAANLTRDDQSDGEAWIAARPWASARALCDNAGQRWRTMVGLKRQTIHQPGDEHAFAAVRRPVDRLFGCACERSAVESARSSRGERAPRTWLVP
jgi:hypothetical protein